MSSPTAEDQPPAASPPPEPEPEPAVEPDPAAEAAQPEDASGQAPPFSPVAIAALPAGILPLVPFGLGLGIAGLVATRRSRRRGRGLALAGLLAAVVWLAAGAALGTVAVLTHGFHKPTKVEYSDQLGAVFSLRAGDCIIQQQDGSSASVTPCTLPHDAEVFATFSLAGTSWPGTAAVQQAADEGCSQRLAGYLNPQLAISLSQDYVYPGEVAWQTGTRTVVCEVRATAGDLDQSVRAATASTAPAS